VPSTTTNANTSANVSANTSANTSAASAVFGVDSNEETTEQFADIVCPSARAGLVDV
jgi:hypothetical protein